jgi:hypothetical protein
VARCFEHRKRVVVLVSTVEKWELVWVRQKTINQKTACGRARFRWPEMQEEGDGYVDGGIQAVKLVPAGRIAKLGDSGNRKVGDTAQTGCSCQLSGRSCSKTFGWIDAALWRAV